MSVRKGCFVGEKMTFLDSFFAFERALTFKPSMFVSLEGTQAWRLHTKLDQFG